MAVSISLYNHTLTRFVENANSASETYRLMLLSSGTFNATHVYLSEVTKTEITAGNGYAEGGRDLTGVVRTVTDTTTKFDANDVVWPAVGGSISALYGILYNASDFSNPVIAFIDFGGTITAIDGSDFRVQWAPEGIATFVVTENLSTVQFGTLQAVFDDDTLSEAIDFNMNFSDRSDSIAVLPRYRRTERLIGS